MSQASILRRTALVATTLTLALSTAACGDSGSPTDSPSPADDTSPAAACTDVLNDRDRDIAEAAGKASLDVLGAALGGEKPSNDELSSWRDALQAGLDQTQEELDLLRGVSEDAAWDDVLSPLADQATIYQSRLELTDESWPVDRSTVTPGPQDPDTETIEALATLDLTDRDCQSLVSDPGPDPDSREFITSAALTCSAIVERRAELDYTDLSNSALNLVAQAASGQDITPTAEDLAALRSLREEWEHTVEDLDGVTADPPDTEAWTAAQQLAEDRVQTYTERLDALESGDPATIAEAFAPGGPSATGWPWSELGLEQRDCRAIDA